MTRNLIQSVEYVTQTCVEKGGKLGENRMVKVQS